MEHTLVFWNVNRLSGASRETTARAERILEFALRDGPTVVGLSEIKSSGLGVVKRVAAPLGYRIVHRDPVEGESHTALLVRPAFRMRRSGVQRTLHPGDGTVAYEATWAVCTVPTDGDAPDLDVTLASVYSHSPWPDNIARVVQQVADNHTEGNVVAGGDWNMARVLDADPGLKHLGSVAFDSLQKELGWMNVLPGQSGTEVPTWPLSRAKGTPRQLDHLFARLPGDFRAAVEVIEPPVAKPSLSDHALLRAKLTE